MKQKKELILSDMSHCTPRSAIAAPPRRNCWQLAEYRTGDGIRGRLLYSGQPDTPPPVQLTLPDCGPRPVRLRAGLVGENGMAGSSGMVRIELTDAAGRIGLTRTIPLSAPVFWPTVYEVPLGTATLKGGGVLTLTKLPGMKGSLAYVRIMPQLPPEPAEVIPDREFSLIATADSYEPFASPDALFDSVKPLAGSAVKRFFFCAAHGDVCPLLPTRVGFWWGGVNAEDICFNRNCDRDNIQALVKLARSGDMIAALRDRVREAGMEFHLSVRLGAFAGLPLAGYFASPFYLAHPEWHCREADGTAIPRLSYAFPEVQEHMLALFQELMALQPDGLNLIFTRGMPLVWHECGPAAEEAAASRMRMDTITGFLRRIRRITKDKCLSAVVPATEKVNHRFGLELECWVAERLVDILLPDQSLQNIEHDEAPENIDLDYFSRLTRGRCGCFPRLPSLHQLYSETEYPGKIQEFMRRLRQKGFDGAMLWDAASTFAGDPGVWSCVGGAGEFNTAELPRRGEFTMLDGMELEHFPSHMCY